MVSISDILSVFDTIEKWRRLSALPNEVAGLKGRLDELEKKLALKDPLICKECGVSPVRIETSTWESAYGIRKMQTVRRICSRCGFIDGRDVEIGNGGPSIRTTNMPEVEND